MKRILYPSRTAQSIRIGSGSRILKAAFGLTHLRQRTPRQAPEFEGRSSGFFQLIQ